MTYTEAANTTLEQFYIYNTAYAIQQEDRLYNAAIQAWFNQSVKATKGKGKSVKSAYKNFQDFYDHEKEFNRLFEIEAPVKQVLTMADKNRLINQMRKERD